MLILFMRTLILYFLVILVMRLMGKRQIGELQPYELVITIMISDLASMPMQDARLPLLLGIIPIITLLFLKILFSKLQLKSQFTRRIIDGEPAVLVYKSKINYKALKSQQINIDELMEAIRLSGYFDLEEISYAILETNGRISILPKTNLAPTPEYGTTNSQNKKLENSTPEIVKDTVSPRNSSPISISGNDLEGELFLPKILISDGKINRNNLTKLNKSDTWIQEKLLEYKVDDIKKVLIALYDTRGTFRYQLYDEFKEGDRFENEK